MSANNIKAKLRHELKTYFLYSTFLALLFFAFTIYERILLGNTSNNYLPYGFCILEALIMAKLIMLGEALKLGEKFSSKPLIIPTLYKTIVFCIFMLIMILAEHFITGLIEGKSLAELCQKFSTRNFNLALARIYVMFFVFILFFAAVETSRELGGNELLDLFFGRQRIP